MKYVCACVLAACLSLSAVCAQQILTANNFFQSVSQQYGAMRDYRANIAIRAGRTSMTGQVIFKRPNLLRIDFSQPDEQVLVFNGDLLTIYLPGPRAVLNQTVSSGTGTGGANLATPQGLTLMSRYYTIAYETGQTPVPLDEGSTELVVRLVLSRKSTVEGFRRIVLSVSPDSKLIRRVEAVTTAGDNYTFNFTNYALNQGIPDTRFLYDAPSAANNYNNFLYSE